MDAPLQILLVDDDEDDYFLAHSALTDTMTHPFSVKWASTYESGLDELGNRLFHVVLLDYRLGKKTGIDFLQEKVVRDAAIPVILLTGQGERKVDLEAMQAGAADYLPKINLAESLERTLRHALERHHDRLALKQMNEMLEGRVAKRTEDLERANAALKEADRRKDEFIAILAHELRNPLAPIFNAIALMKEGENDLELCRDARSTVERQLVHMARLVDDLLEVSRFQQGKIELRKSTIELQDICRQAIETVKPLFDKKHQRFTANLVSTPVVVEADPARLIQVVGNLMNNASKFTPENGEIELSLEIAGDDAILSVKDNGVGMIPEQLPRIFDLFTQLDGSHGRMHEGLGIGLTLVQNLVHMHGGTIDVHSDGPGLGSEFVVSLPITSKQTAPAAPRRSAEPEVSLARFRILVVDDNRDAASTLAMLLKFNKHDVVVAYDGFSGIAEAERFQPEIVLMDIGLPGMNGLEAARLIRQQPWGTRMVLVAMTGWGQEEDRRRSSEAGFDRHLVKPVDRNTLMKLIGEAEQLMSR